MQGRAPLLPGGCEPFLGLCKNSLGGFCGSLMSPVLAPGRPCGENVRLRGDLGGVAEAGNSAECGGGHSSRVGATIAIAMAMCVSDGKRNME